MSTPVEQSWPARPSSPGARPAREAGHRPVRIGTEVVGGPVLPVLAGPRSGAPIVHVSLRRLHGSVPAVDELRRIRDLSAAPLLVEPFSAADLTAVETYADGVVVGPAWMQDFRLLSAVGELGLPVVVHRAAHCTVDEWLSAAAYVEAGGSDEIVLCEAGGRGVVGERPSLDLALIREVRDCSGRPVTVDVSGAPWLAGAAVAAGADGIWFAEGADVADVDAAREATTMLTPVVRQVRGDSIEGCRDAIDRVDAALASLLEYRVGLAGRIQQLKPVGGHAGRDPGREAEIVRGMARRAPSLTREHLSTIMDAVITAGLDTAESTSEPPVWRL